MDDIKQAGTAYGALVQNLQKAEQDVLDMEHRVSSHNKKMLYAGARLHDDIAVFKEQMQALRDDLENYKHKLLQLVGEVKDAVHEEQVVTLGKHVDSLQFEKALLRSQVKDMIKKSL